MKKYLLLCLLSLIHLGLFAQNQILKGQVVSEDDLPIPGISIYLPELKKGVHTNSQGYYVFQDVPKGSYQLEIFGLGYTKKVIEITVPQTTNISPIKLKESIEKLNQVVISGGKKNMKDVPGSVHYLSARELEEFNYTDINRSLKSVPGVNIQEEDGFGLRPNIGMRGTGVERSSKITLMEDGILMAPAPYSASAAYYFPTFGRMDGLEVMKGHSQIKYGPNTNGGALNLISATIPEELMIKLDMNYGGFNTGQGHLRFGNKSGQVSYVLETFQHRSDGFKELDGGGNTGFVKSDYLAKVRIESKERAKIRQSVMIKAGAMNENSNETYLGISEADFNQNPYRRYIASEKDNIKAEQRQFSVRHEIFLSNRIKLNSSAYYNTFHRNWYKLDKVLDSSGSAISISNILDEPSKYQRAYDLLKGSNSIEDEELLVKANNRTYFSRGIQGHLTAQLDDENKYELEVGLRYHEDQMDRFQWVDGYEMTPTGMNLKYQGVHGTESNRIEYAFASSAYAQFKANWKSFTIYPGFRAEKIAMRKMDYGKSDPDRTGSSLKSNGNDVTVFLPGLGMEYRLNKHARVFAGYHKGFAPPSSSEGVEAELSDNYELGFRHFINTWNLTSTLFYNDYSNLQGSDLNAAGGTGSGDLFNGGSAISYGLEFQMSYDLMALRKTNKFGLPVSITYTYTDARFKSSFASDFDGWGNVESGDQLPYLAMHQAAIQLGLEWGRMSTYLAGRYMDAMRTVAGKGAIPSDQKTDAYFVTDLSLKYRFTHYLSASAQVSNLTDEIYIVARRPAGVRPGMPRFARIGLHLTF